MPSEDLQNGHKQIGQRDAFPQPLQQSGALQKFDYEDITPVIGREFPNLNVSEDILNANNVDELIRDLAITISQRCVVFFRSQNNLTEEQQKHLINRLGELSGKPPESQFFINPIQPIRKEASTVTDPTITRITSAGRGEVAASQPNPRRFDEALWHADGQFERFPPSFTSLRLTEVPKSGGDTLWASGYELYDRFSRPYQKFLEALTATFIGDGYTMSAEKYSDRIKLYEGCRGHPENINKDLKVTHPVVRTHPVSGWKHIFPVGPRDPRDYGSPKYINELHGDESEEILTKFYDMILKNHDLTVRFKWKNPNDMAIWDNRCAFHSATFDYDGLGVRAGVRTAGVGEAPYFDPSSKSRTEMLFGSG